MFDRHKHPQRRVNSLNGDCALVSPQRAKRPWYRQTEAVAPTTRSKRDPNCYLCLDSTRVSGQRNPEYCGLFVFSNDFLTLLSEAVLEEEVNHALLQSQPESGECR